MSKKIYNKNAREKVLLEEAYGDVYNLNEGRRKGITKAIEAGGEFVDKLKGPLKRLLGKNKKADAPLPKSKADVPLDPAKAVPPKSAPRPQTPEMQAKIKADVAKVEKQQKRADRVEKAKDVSKRGVKGIATAAGKGLKKLPWLRGTAAGGGYLGGKHLYNTMGIGKVVQPAGQLHGHVQPVLDDPEKAMKDYAGEVVKGMMPDLTVDSIPGMDKLKKSLGMKPVKKVEDAEAEWPPRVATPEGGAAVDVELESWWEYDPHDVVVKVYHGALHALPPAQGTPEYERNFEKIFDWLEGKYPLPSEDEETAFGESKIYNKNAREKSLLEEAYISVYREDSEKERRYEKRWDRDLDDERDREGSSSAGEYSDVDRDDFCGPAGGAAPGTYPVNSEKRARAALSYAHNAPDPEGIKRCVYRKAKEHGWFDEEDEENPDAHTYDSRGREPGPAAELDPGIGFDEDESGSAVDVDLESWWEYDPHDVVIKVYHGALHALPPAQGTPEYERNFEKIFTWLEGKYPSPSEDDPEHDAKYEIEYTDSYRQRQGGREF
jgi:hypothetical protein